ncbi:NHLP bacteriocin export ABC transporter permease/ATPase subunit [Phormidium sp. FACHB-592]|uniref:NHLP bacteriocin export ABC transporter permease/ATPase subunit n=1 Tax=Stenomitos frigidus AS-A4 TaxID=2933935 RepID=A0ABV0KSK3_9CYAN|nr:NHLP bacteriocin export ABC transporter permease/ATPase subunit [Phormidium sp. FACHB-592]MBD2077180.1 NHLP bacteriocin export ABC transporter permease/ATPase subunit [Phormidium sp. FACHB-592]
MVSQLETKAQEQACKLRGNQPMLLNQPETMWVIQSGSVALFAVMVGQDGLEGTRHYLFSASSGEALFGRTPSSEPHQRQLLAVPIEETELLQVQSGELRQRLVRQDEPTIAQIDHWVNQLGAAPSQSPVPGIHTKAAGAARVSLTRQQTLQPTGGTVVWMQIQQGTVRWNGSEELLLNPSTGLVPFSDRLWMEALDDVQLVTQSTEDIQNLDALLVGLSQLQTYVLSGIDRLEQQAAQAELQRLQAQARLNYQVTTEALGELASTLGTSAADFFADDSPLLVAARAIGKVLGVTIHPPAASEDFKRVKEPLEAIMRASRVRMRRVLLRDHWWTKGSGPLAAYTRETNQLVALLPVSATCYHLFNPVDRTHTPIDADIAATLTPVAYMFYRPLPDKALKTLELLRFALKGCVKDLLVILVTGIAATLLGMFTPQATAMLIDNAIPDADRGLLLQVGLGLLVVALGTAAFRIAQGLAILRVETVSDAATQAAVWDRLLSLPVSFFRQYTTGDLQSRVTSISQIRRQLSGTTVINLVSALFALLNLGLLFYYNVKLALVAIAVALVTIAVTTLSGIMLIRKIRPLLELQGTIFGHTVQLINGLSKLRVAGAEERAFATWSKRYSQQVKLNLSTQHLEDGIALFNTLLPTLTSAILFWLTMQLLAEAKTAGTAGLTVGTFLAFNSAFGTFIGGATNLSNTATNLLQVIPQAKRAQPILATVPEVDLSKADPGRLTGKISIDHITFRYRDSGALTLDDVSLHAEPGEFIALVGGSGSGKSTLFRLLLGFETPESGTIAYDGQDLTGLNVEAVRRQLGVVLQGGRLLSGSIFDNIASGAQITLNEAWEAAQMAGFAEDVAAMPMEMHTVISEGGGNLSGGQRQRLLIARALVLKPRILLFDEATSALDNRTQAIVSESLDRLQVTRLVIAHRLSTIRNAHRIYVLQGGRVTQQGCFKELAAQAGLFAELMKRQMG